MTPALKKAIEKRAMGIAWRNAAREALKAGAAFSWIN